MAQRYKFSIESKSFPLDISGEPFYSYIRERFKTPRLDCIIGLSVTYNDFVTLYHRAPNANQLDGERKPIGLRTQTDWTADANRLDGGRERYKPATIYLQYNRESS